MNKVILLWNITQDLELKQTPNWHAVLNLSMATNSKVKNWDNWEDEVEFHNLTAWGKTAETIAKFCSKWSKILVEWQLETRSWEDKETQAKRYKTEIIVRSFEFAWGKSDWQANPNKVQSDQDFANQVKTENWVDKQRKIQEDISIEDIPF